jgi:hypothetical protein
MSLIKSARLSGVFAAGLRRRITSAMPMFVYLTVFPFAAGAADFRALDVGQSCGTVRDWELARGSTQIPSHADSGLEIYAFTTEDFGRHVVVTYACVNGALRDGSWRFPDESWQQAVERYRGLYGSLESTYGRAAVVGHPWDDTNDQKFIADNWFKLTSMWVLPKGNATVTLNIQPTPPFKPELPKWSIDITVSEAHIKSELKKG